MLSGGRRPPVKYKKSFGQAQLPTSDFFCERFVSAKHPTSYGMSALPVSYHNVNLSTLCIQTWGMCMLCITQHFVAICEPFNIHHKIIYFAPKPLPPRLMCFIIALVWWGKGRKQGRLNHRYYVLYFIFLYFILSYCVDEAGGCPSLGPF